MKQRSLLILIAFFFPFSTEGASPTNALENLTLDAAFEIAERLHPELVEARALVEAASGRAEQAGAFPNPEAIVGAQQLPLEGNASNQKEYVAGIAQPIPLGGRLGKARKAELLEREVRAYEAEVTRRNLRKRVHSAFATALYQEKAFVTQSRILEGAARAVAMTEARMEAGDALPEDVARVQMELALAKVELRRAETSREQSVVALTAEIGDANLNVKSLSGSLDITFAIPTLEELVASLSDQPESQVADANVRASRSRVDLAQAERIPDVKVETLYHRLESTRENTFDIGLSIALPLFDRNQGRLREARADVAAAEARARATQNQLIVRFRESHAQLTTALSTSRTLKDEILSRADTVLETAEARYDAGDISLGELLPVRREWAAAQLTYLESLRDVMQAWAELASLLNSRW